MGFFADLKEDLSQAVNELMPQEQQVQAEEVKAGIEEKDTGGENTVNLASEVSLDEMLKNIDDFRLPEDEMSMGGEAAAQSAENVMADIVDSVEAAGQEADAPAEQTADPAAGLWVVEELPEDLTEKAEKTEAEDAASAMERFLTETAAAETEETQTAAGEAWGWKAPETEEAETAAAETEDAAVEEVTEETGLNAAEEQNMEMMPRMPEESPAAEQQEEQEEVQREEQEEIQREESKGAEETMEMNERVVLDETSVITAGMVVTGDINTEGSVDVAGTVNGNIDAYGKLNITGHINGNSKAAEIYAENAKINGQIVSEGAVKIESSTVIIGNITATSAAIAGAVKGDIDVKGPVILDASAIVMGNIKSKSVQINNGAVIEGMCSQCYADVNPTSFFDDYKPEVQTKSKSK